MKHEKIYYNLTRIENGWLLQYPIYVAFESRARNSVETYFPTLTQVLKFVDNHFQGLSFDKEPEKTIF